jgi:hypothetical protein
MYPNLPINNKAASVIGKASIILGGRVKYPPHCTNYILGFQVTIVIHLQGRSVNIKINLAL